MDSTATRKGKIINKSIKKLIFIVAEVILTVPDEPVLTKPMSAPCTPLPAPKQSVIGRLKGVSGVTGVTAGLSSAAEDVYNKMNTRYGCYPGLLGLSIKILRWGLAYPPKWGGGIYCF